jgi:UDP-N-acetylmuramoyl-L-alanyl-D-glutamate--2,6-diaminopimelate ligase
MSNDCLAHGSFADLKKFTQLDWRLEEATAQTVVAYQLAADAVAQKKLQERLAKNKPGLLILSRAPSFEVSCPYWVVKECQWSRLLHLVCEKFFPINRKTKLLAITGTNGKTTTADLVLQLGEMAGLVGFSIGTLGVRQKGKTLEEFGLTTPGQIQLRKILFQYGAKADFAVMEASSHALDQDRVHGLQFAGAAWTNFTQDHLDYHRSMEEYFHAKEKLVHYLAPGAKLFVPEKQSELVKKLSAQSVLQTLSPITVTQDYPAFLYSSFNQENLACALALAGCIVPNVNKLNLTKLLPPPGRFYVRQWQGRVAIVDFAHTPDALENILTAIRSSYPGCKLITLFGCGGDRDRSKRPLMAQAVDQFSDELIVTSDNPRTENPEQIIQDIVKGIKLHPYTIEVERPVAVRTALAALQSGDVLLMAGKGHEDYILKGTVKIPYSDIEELDRFVATRQG